MIYEDLPLWFRAILERAGSDTAAWGPGDPDFNIGQLPDFLRALFEVALANLGSWYGVGSDPGAFYSIPDYYRQIFDALGPQVAVLLEDDFTGGSAPLNGRTPDTVGAGTWSVYNTAGTTDLWTDNLGNAFVVAGSGGPPWGVYDVGTDTYTITMDFYLNTIIGCVFRYQDTLNGWHVRISLADQRIRERAGSTVSIVRATTVQARAPGEYQMVLTVSPTSIHLDIGGVITSYSSPTLGSETKCGIYGASNDVSDKYRNIKVTG